MPRPLPIFSQSNHLIKVADIYSHTKWQTVQIQISWLLQKPTDLDLHCLQRQTISGFSRTRVKTRKYTVFAFLDIIILIADTFFRVLIKPRLSPCILFIELKHSTRRKWHNCEHWRTAQTSLHNLLGFSLFITKTCLFKIYWKFYHKKMKIFREKIRIFFIFLLKT